MAISEHDQEVGVDDAIPVCSVHMVIVIVGADFRDTVSEIFRNSSFLTITKILDSVSDIRRERDFQGFPAVVVTLRSYSPALPLCRSDAFLPGGSLLHYSRIRSFPITHPVVFQVLAPAKTFF